MFPARVGMNRYLRGDCVYLWDVPRACGDEPRSGAVLSLIQTCSPRVWG